MGLGHGAGPHRQEAKSRTWIDGHFLGVPKYAKNKDWSLEFIAHGAAARTGCCARWMRGNAPPRGSVLRDPDMVEQDRLAADRPRRRSRPGIPTPAHPVWDTLELSLRTGVSQALLGQKTAKQALDEVAADWQRSLRRAGIGRG